LIKKRAFADKPGTRYDICTICSHKFFVKQLYEEYSARCKRRDKNLHELEKAFNDKKNEYLDIRTQHNTRKREVK